MPPGPAVSLAAVSRPYDQTKAYGWRGRAAGGKGADVVAFVNEETCTDVAGASTRSPCASLSLTVASFRAAAGGPLPAPRQSRGRRAKPTPSPAPTPAPALGDWISSLVSFFPSIDACVHESPRTEAIVFAAAKPDKTVQLVLRLPVSATPTATCRRDGYRSRSLCEPEGAAPSAPRSRQHTDPPPPRSPRRRMLPLPARLRRARPALWLDLPQDLLRGLPRIGPLTLDAAPSGA